MKARDLSPGDVIVVDGELEEVFCLWYRDSGRVLDVELGSTGFACFDADEEVRVAQSPPERVAEHRPRPSCGHPECADDDGHIDECLWERVAASEGTE